MPEADRRRRATHISGGKGQTLVIVALALPMFFAIVSLVIDGSTLMAKRRGMQNAADASSLAAAQELVPGAACTGPDTLPATCLGRVKAKASTYSTVNGGPPVGHACAGASDTNCYTTPYNGNN